MKMHPYQASAVKRAKAHFASHNRGKVVWPCGMGKTFVSVKLAKSMGAKKVLVCVPSLSLVKQSLEVWKSEFKSKDTQWMCVCSDTSIRRQRDAWEVEPGSLGITVTTSPEEIGKFLRGRSGGVKIVFTTYQSGAQLSEGAARVRFDFGVFDEAHNTAGVSGALFSRLLSNDAINIRKRLFMTATERFYRGKRDDVVSMSDEKVYGTTIDSISFKRALDDGHLCDYKIVVMSVTESAVKKAILDNVGVQAAGGAVEASMAAAALVLRKVVKDKKIKRVISFHGSVDKAKRFAGLNESLNTKSLSIAPMHINGSQSGNHRNAVMEDFRSSKLALMTNCQCLTEGVDVPDVDAVLFADPKKSTVDIVQAAGRAIRKADGKTMSYIIVPVIVPDEDGGEASYNAAIDVIRHLGSVDERIIDYFNPANADSREGGIVEFSGVEHGEVAFESLSESVRVKYWDRVSGLVPFLPFEEAREYVRGLGLASSSEFRVWSNASRHAFIPAAPDGVYRDKWAGWPDFLGYARDSSVAKVDFWTARKFARGLGLMSLGDWFKFRSSGDRPPNIPSNPNKQYEDEWAGWPDFLGYIPRRVRGPGKLPFHESRSLVRRIGLRSRAEYRELAKAGRLPPGVPAVPDSSYPVEWCGWSDFIGHTRSQSEDKLCFHEARGFARSLGFQSSCDWDVWVSEKRRPGFIPCDPVKFYKNEWTSWPDFLGYTPKRKVAD